MSGGIYSRLNEVFRVLERGHSIKDDTILLLLFDEIKRNVTDAESIVESGIANFIQKVTSDPAACQSSTLVFTEQLVGWIGSNEQWFTLYQCELENLVSIVWSTPNLKENASVFVAYFACLKDLSTHPASLKWIISKHPEIVRSCVDITVPGIFLQKARTDFVTSCFKMTLDIGESDKTVAVFGQEILDMAITNLNSVAQNLLVKVRLGQPSVFDIQRVRHLSSVLEEFVTSSHSATQTVVVHESLLNNLTKMMCSLDMIYFEPVANIFAKLLNGRCDHTYVEEQITQALLTLSEAGYMKKVQTLALICVKCNMVSLQTVGVKLLLGPIQCIVSAECNPQMDVFSQLWTRLTTGKIKQSAFTQILCTSVTAMEQMKEMYPELVSTLLMYTTGMHNLPDHLQSIAGHLRNNVKLQTTCVHLFNSITDRSNMKPHKTEIFTAILDIVANKDCGFVLYSACTKCLLPWLPEIVSGDDGVALATRLSDILQHHLSAMQWEIRDTTLEFLRTIVQQHSDNASIVEWLLAGMLHVHIWQCVVDGESYVRASAISSLYQLMISQPLHTALLKHTSLSESDIVLKLVSVLESDSEAFARRSAATFILNYFVAAKSNPNIINIIQQAAVKATNDFDCDVKLIVFAFIKTFIECKFSEVGEDENESKQQAADSPLQLSSGNQTGVFTENESSVSTRNHTASKSSILSTLQVFDELCDIEVVPVLMKGLVDYDVLVCEEAFTVCKDLRERLVRNIDIPEHSGGLKYFRTGDHSVNSTTTGNSNVEHEQDSDGQTSAKRLKLCNASEAGDGVSNPVEKQPMWLCKLNEHLNTEKGDFRNTDTLMEVLNLDIEVYHRRKSCQTAGNDDIFSIIEDILSTENKKDPSEEAVSIDCY